MMSNFLTTLAGARIESAALTVRPNSDTVKIVSRFLDGGFSVQQIGQPATTLQITVAVRDKSVLDGICGACAPIKVYHYNKIYTGIISSSAITWLPILGNRRYRGSFEVSVTEEALR